jgi:hypothetical protein
MSYSRSGRGFTKPPAGTQIAWGHALSQGLIAACAFNEGGGNGTVQHIYDSVSNKLATSASTASSIWTSTAHGKALQFVAQNGEYTFAPRGITQKWSCAFHIAFGDFSLDYSICGSSANGIQVRQSGGGRIQVLKTADSVMGTDLTPAMSVGVFYHIGVSYEGAVLRFYRNGLPNGTASVAQTFTDGQFQVGANGSGNEELGGNAKLVYFYLWKRALAGSDFQCIAAEPYALWASSPYRRYFVEAAHPSGRALYYARSQGLL